MCSKNNFYTINNVTKDSFIQTASMEENSQDFYRDFVVTRRGLTLRDLRPTLGFTKHLLYTQDLKNNNFSFHKSKNEEYLIFRLNDE